MVLALYITTYTCKFRQSCIAFWELRINDNIHHTYGIIIIQGTIMKQTVVMLMCSGSLGAGKGMLIWDGVLLLLSGHFGPLEMTMHQAWHDYLQASCLVRQNDVGGHLWWWHGLHHIGDSSHHLHQQCESAFVFHLGPTSGWLLVWILLFTRGALASVAQWPILPCDWYVESLKG